MGDREEAGRATNFAEVETKNAFKKLLRVTAYVKRFIQNLKQKKEKGRNDAWYN